MKLEVNEEILVYEYFIGKVKGPERFLAWYNDNISNLEEKCMPFSGLILIPVPNTWLTPSSLLL